MPATWEKDLDFDEVTTKIDNYIEKIKDDNGEKSLFLSQPKLIFSYILERDLSNYINLLRPKDITSIYHQDSGSDFEYQNNKRQRILQLLCVAHKAHFFLYNQEKCMNKPRYFEYPNFINPTESLLAYELVYTLSNGKTILVSEWNSENKTLTQPNQIGNLEKFPVALNTDYKNWNDSARWKLIRKLGEDKNDQYGIDVIYNTNSYNKTNKDIVSKEVLNDLVDCFEPLPDRSDRNNYFYIEHICRLCGGIKASIDNKDYFYWPFGWDTHGVKEFINFAKNKENKFYLQSLIKWA